MISSILVGLNGIQFSQAAAQHAIVLADRLKVPLIGVAVVDVADIAGPEPVPLGAGEFKHRRDTARLTAVHQRCDELLEQFQFRCQTSGVSVQLLKAEGNPAEVLAIESQRADLVVVGKKHLPEENWESFSHSLRDILHQVPRPTLCVPAAREYGRDILIAYDGSQQAAKALQLFVHSGLAGEHPVHLLSVANQAAEIAKRGLEFLNAHEMRVQTHYYTGDNAAGRILEVAHKLDAGMIVMGAYGQRPVREWILGSVTQSILKKTTVPLFLYH